MQRTKGTGKKNQGRIGAKEWEKMPIPSLRLIQKTNPDKTMLDRLTSSFLSLIESRTISSPTNQTDASFDKDADTNLIEAYLAKLAVNITAYQKTLDDIETKTKELRKNKQEIPKSMYLERRRLRELIDHLKIDQISGLAENIREHSARRIDLFFLLLIAVYKQNVDVAKAYTAKQHGKGDEKTLTAGCHSSLFPCLKFTKIEISNLSGILDNILAMVSISPSAQPSPNGEQILEGTHFAEALNTTMQLPECVNQFDTHLERQGSDTSSLVQIANNILNKTSRGEINPIQGLDEFCDALYSSFNSLYLKYVHPGVDYNANGTRGKAPRSFALILENEREGAQRMMAFYDKDKIKHAKASWDYVFLMLNLHRMPYWKRAANHVYSRYLDERILEIQQEIYKWKFDPKNEEYKKTDEYKRTLTK